MTVEIILRIAAGIVAAGALAAAGALIRLGWPLDGMHLSERIWQRLGRIALWWWERRDRRRSKP